MIAVCPLSAKKYIKPLLQYNGVIAIELIDSVENIFDRLVFSDGNDVIYKDDEYKMRYKKHYINGIVLDFMVYGQVFEDIKNCFDINGNNPEDAANMIIYKYLK